MRPVAVPDLAPENSGEIDRDWLSAIVQSSMDAIVGKTTTGIVTSWNPAAAELFGWTSTEMVGQPIGVLIPAHRRDEEAELLLRVAAGERIDPYETERLTKAGETVHVALSASPVQSSSGEIEGVASIYISIEWIAKREAILQTLLEAAHDAIVGVDPAGLIHSVNGQAEELFGYAHGELVGLPVDVLIPESLTDLQPKHRLSYFAERTSRPIGTGLEINARRKDGTGFPIDIALSSLQTEEGVIGVAVRDISDRIRVARERDQLEQRIEHSRLETLGHLVDGISHDFKNLIAGITFTSRLVQESLKKVDQHDPKADLEQIGSDMEQIIETAGRATSLIEKLLLFGGRDEIQAELVDLNEIVGGMEDLLRRTLGEPVLLTTDLAHPLGRVWADVGHLERILMNLVINARDAMPAGGSLVVRTCEKTLDDAYPPPPGIDQGGYVVLSVSDTGTGMLPEVIERAFEPNFSTKPRGEGSGLGLATVYGVVKESGGHISIFSEVGLGTTFNVYFPVGRGEDPSDE